MVDFNKMKQFMESAQKRQKSLRGGESGVDWFVMSQDGSYEVRILDIPMITSGSHWGILNGVDGRNGGPVKCPRVLKDEPCPVCEMVEMLSNSSSQDEREQAKKLKARIKYPILLIDLSEEGEPKPRIWEAPFQALEDIHSWGSNPKYGDITHPKNGRNVTIVRSTVKKGSFEYPEFKVQPDPDRTPIDIEGVKLPDLDEVFKPRSYEDIEYALANGEYPKLEEQDGGDQSKNKKPNKPAPTKYSKGLPATKTREEEEVEDDDTEEVESPAVSEKPKSENITKMLQGRLAGLRGKK